ncbi:receptor-type tyrosine-protein phosphatase T [Aplysia californica]|uniref:protein-tyrosine-phosphatase n=1 Tax=Aplysia californica TaxID=6500 RepID=A0ABM0ZYE5_APLCA|nr:receptor-type tyrosine-protein phosphatase T [Aplysia californica]
MAVNGRILTFLSIIQLILVSILADCDPGYFGWKCRLQCGRCLGGAVCEPVNGTCRQGCAPGYYGEHCLFESRCRYNDKAGTHYRGSMSTTAQGKTCVDWDLVPDKKDITFNKGDEPGNFCRNPLLGSGRQGELWCFTKTNTSEKGDVYTFSLCNVTHCECPPHLYGEGCKEQCHCSDLEDCDINGHCPTGCAPGWYGLRCNKKCERGLFGLRCQSKCSDKCLYNNCDAETGKCVDGCVEGFQGENCTIECMGKYGRNCQMPCGHCNDSPCHRETGHCKTGCVAGYSSSVAGVQLCDVECRHGFYGPSCVNKCGACRHRVTCDPVSGECPDGCQDGYKGKLCAKLCPSHMYGRDCLKKCGVCKDKQSCDPFTGRCSSGCEEGHTGFECIQRIKAKNNSASVALGAGLGVGAILIIVMLVFCIVYRKRTKKLKIPGNSVEVEDPLTRDESCQLLGDSRIGSEPPSFVREEDDNVRNEVQEPIYENVNNRKQTCPVAIPALYDYILKNKENGCEGFKKEFQELPMGLIAFCDIARKQENRVKNRYGNIFAYDHSRVILDPLPNEPNSDYVNANYMDGYSRPKAYIASQGPNKVMIRDFWRMVWQQRVSKIVMLTNLMEACKKKCEQYWPEDGSNKYGDITVLLVNATKYSDFTIRTFELTKEMEHNRIVKQFHFTTWSDHGAPTHPTTLLAFRRKVMNFKPDDTAPVLSHCSAGIGRTGTFIALNYLLEQAADKNEVDVLGCAQLLRANRVNMIQTLEQYVFVYEAVLEAIKTGNTTIARSSFHSTYEEMLSREGEEESPMEKQHDVLQLLSPTMEREECSAALMEENMAKNRFKNILPANRSRPFLYTPVEDCNDYINAVYLAGYTQKDKFIVTQMPLPTTVADFWRMLYDTSSDTIIMLNEFDRNDKSCALYWPEEYGYSEEHGPLSVELLSSSEADNDVTLRVFKLSHLDKGEERAIKQFMFKSWPDYQTTPHAVTPLLRLYRLVMEWLKQNSKGPVTIHCMNGASKSGVFVAMSLLLERLDLDYEVDVYQTVKQIRINRPQFIENIEQYKFLYQIVQEYMDQE